MNKEDKLKKSARRGSIREGLFASASNAFGMSYLSPFAIAINASSSVVALLSSVSGILGPLSQMFGSKFIGKYPRKKIVMAGVLLESIMWLPFIAIAILFYLNMLTKVLPLFILLTFAFFVISGSFAVPAWFSWMGDITEEKHRGRFFSKRNLLTGFTSVVLAIAASFFLDYFKSKNWIMFGFIILFSLAFIARLISWHLFSKKYEPKIKVKDDDHFSFFSFIVQAPKTNFGRFAIFRSTLAFANSISAPLIAIYLLRHLQFSYKTYMIIIFAGTVFQLSIIELWGKFADRYGNFRVISITSLLIPLIPIVWILNPSPIYLLIVPAVVRGAAWAGFNLAAGNFIYDNVKPQKRGTAVSYYHMLVGIGLASGAAVGALLIKVIQTSFMEPIILIFIIGAIVRMLAVFFFLPKIKEIKKTGKFNGKAAFKNLIFKQAKPTLAEEAHQIMHIPKYIIK
jgi:MFS family permease